MIAVISIYQTIIQIFREKDRRKKPIDYLYIINEREKKTQTNIYLYRYTQRSELKIYVNQLKYYSKKKGMHVKIVS